MNKLEEFGSSKDITKDLTEGKDRIDLLVFERKLGLAVNKVDKAEADHLIRELEEGQLPAEQKELAPLTKLVVRLQILRNQCPSLPNDAATPPDKAEVRELETAVPELKTQWSKHSSFLESSATYLPRVIRDSIDQGEHYLKRWSQFWSEFAEYETATGETKKKKLDLLKEKYQKLKMIKDLK